jgi:hypothetical protein
MALPFERNIFWRFANVPLILHQQQRIAQFKNIMLSK